MRIIIEISDTQGQSSISDAHSLITVDRAGALMPPENNALSAGEAPSILGGAVTFSSLQNTQNDMSGGAAMTATSETNSFDGGAASF